MNQLNAATRLQAADSWKDEVEVTFKVSGEANHNIPKLLALLSSIGQMGTGCMIDVEDNGGEKTSFYFDGDGADKIEDLKVNGKPFTDD
jgi:hypothetical protein